MTQVWVYDENSIFVESKMVDKIEELEGNMTRIPLLIGYLKPRFTGTEWLEGATEEEIKEWEEKNKPKPKEPTETEILQKQLLETQNMLLELQYKLTNKDLTNNLK